MTEIEQPPQNGIDLSTAEEDDSSKSRPADIEQDMREMERRKRVEAIMSSKLFREELERIVDAAREGGSSGVLQQLSDIVGVPLSRVSNVFKTSNCMLPINDIRGVESMGYAKGEKILRCKLAATFRLLDLYGWTQGLGAQITARLKVDQEYFLVNPFGLLYHEITASALNKVDMQGQVIEQGTTNFGVNKNHFVLHSAVHAARPDIRCVIYIGCSPVVAISSLKTGLLPLTKDACVLGEITTHPYTGSLFESEERDKFIRNLGPNSKVMLLSNHGALCCGETIEEAFFSACHIVQACETQLKLLPVGLDNLVLIPEESRKIIFEQSRRPPEDLEKKFAAVSTADANAVQQGQEETATAPTFKVLSGAPKWRVGGAEFEALMRMLDNAGYRTGYIYRHPLIKSDPPRPKNDVELPPAVSSLGYLLEEEELFRQGIWKKGDLRKGGDRSRWLNSPNVYQKVEVLETGTPDPKKITKWVAEGSPTHSTPVRIEDPLQFVPTGTNTKEFKRLQQQIKDNRRADKISAGPQSHILEGVTWDEANRIKDATVSSAGDHVVLMGAASKGIIQRGYQHNATVYKAPYAKNPFDNVTDDELNEYKRTVERKKKSIHGEYTDTDFSESEPLSSLQTSGAQQTKQNTTTTTAAISQSEPEDISEHQVMRIETQQAPIPSQPEVVLSDATQSFLNGERAHTDINRKTYTGRDKKEEDEDIGNEEIQDLISCPKVVNAEEVLTSRTNKILTAKFDQDEEQVNKENIYCGHQNILQNSKLIAEMKNDIFFKRQEAKFKSNSPPLPLSPKVTELENDKIIGDNDSSISNAQKISKHHKQSNVHNNESTSNLNPDTMCTQSCLMNTSSTPTTPCINHAFSNIFMSHTTASCCKPVCYEPFLELYESKNYNNSSSAVYAESIDTNMLQNEYENAKSKSIFCYTPAICNRIFESLQCPLDNNLILNIPFSITAPSSNSTRTTTPRKIQIDNQQDLSYFSGDHKLSTQHGPYRTVSHFGFNSPQQEFQPEHKHIPLQYSSINDSRKYIPIQKTVSYEEIFSSPRYVELCENCFERVVRLKPELLQIRTHLRNLVDFQTSKTINKQSKTQLIQVGDSNTEHNNIEEVVYSYPITDCEYSESNSSDTTETLPPFYSHLEPLIEAEEDEEGDDSKQITLERGNLKQACNGNIEQAVSSSSFIEKIMRMNYSEESTNVNFVQTPRTVSSNFSIETPETVTAVPENNVEVQFKNVENICNTIDNHDTKDVVQLNTHTETLNTKVMEVEVHASVTEIWEFDDWQTQNLLDVEEENVNEKNDMKVDKNEIKNYSNLSYQQERCLMTREERIRRKLEFQELWEDHIAYFDDRDESFTSDNEMTSNSDINIFNQIDQDLENHIKHIDEMHFNGKRSKALPRNEKEIFHGCSVVMKSRPELSCQSDAEQNTQKINIITQISTENRFFHDPSTLDCTVANINDCRINSKASECSALFNEFVENTVDIFKPENKNVILHKQDVGTSMEQDENMVTVKNQNRKINAYLNDNDNLLTENNQSNSQEFLNTEVNDNCVVSNTTMNIKVFNPNDTKKLISTEINELSDIEVEILDKIEKNQLKLSEEIFDKIDASIRNKLTPSKIEHLLKEQQRVVCSSTVLKNNFIASTPISILNDEHVEDNLQSANVSDIKEYPSIASSSFDSYEKSLTVTTKSNKVYTPIRSSNSLQKNITQHIMELHSKSCLRPNKLVYSGQKTFNKRNFILENIRNVSKPRNLKRCKKNLLKSSGKAKELLPTPCSLPLMSCANSNTLDGVTDTDSVYSFESSSINGAQRFWVSLSPRQITREKCQKNNSSKNEHEIYMKTQSTSPDEPNDSLCIVEEMDIQNTDELLHTSISTSTFILESEVKHSNMEHEIQGLCEQIDEIKPRLETFKDKIYDYSKNMAMCSRNVDECIEVHKDIVSRQCELREEILLNQYMEQIASENVQNGDHSEAHLSTFSQSSKEDISTDGSPKKDKKKKKGLRTPSFLKKKKEKKKTEA